MVLISMQPITILKEMDAPGRYNMNGPSLEENTDIFCPMYMRIEGMEKYAISTPDRPLILCEYAHAMGNTCWQPAGLLGCDRKI